MKGERLKRKLSAILSADVQGYSRLMGEDEKGTVRTLEVYREIITMAVGKYGGRVVDSPGDNILSEFQSAVDAVECAVEIQTTLKNENRALPENRRMVFRIGMNLGDVIVEGERIYGDGVNIAARIEGLADGGGICLSKNIHDQVKNKLSFDYEYLGEHRVKNITEPIPVYKVILEDDSIAGMETLPLPDKPSIAVLPLMNMSGDPAQEYIADGISENIIASLSRISEMFVVARNSTFFYKGKACKAQKIGKDLGVQYILEGSIQRSANRIRITAQLIDTTTGHHLWTERYDRSMEDFFDLQDEITQQIVTALQIELTDGERALAYKKTTNFEAWSYLVQAIGHVHRFTREDAARARTLAKRAVESDPEFVFPLTVLGWTHVMDAGFGTGASSRKHFKEAAALAEKAVTMDDALGDAHSLLGYVRLFQREYDEALSEGARAVALDPNNANSHAILAHTMLFSGDFDGAIGLFHRAMRLSPYFPDWFLIHLGNAYYMKRQYDKAIEYWKRYLRIIRQWGLSERRLIAGHVGLIAGYWRSGQRDKAHHHLSEVLRINPNFDINNMHKLNPYRNPKHLGHIITALRDAGLPESEQTAIPEKPSLAVLPFRNLSGDPEQEYFSDGITEEIITALSKIQRMIVIARNSAFTYKGKSVQVQEIARELGVRFVLEGSVRRSEEKVRITAQLVDGVNGNHLWSDRYDRDLKDIFALQDEITMRIITALQVELTEGEQARISGNATDNLEAYLKVLQAREHFYRMNKHGSMRARELAREAILLDSKYGAPHVIMALTHMMDLWFYFTDSPEESMKLAVDASKKALALDESNPSTHAGLCMLFIMQRKHDAAVEAGKRAVALGPSGAMAHYSLGTAMDYAGRQQEALMYLKKAISLNPFPSGIFFRGLGNTYRMSGDYENAITEYDKTLRLNPDDLFAHLGLVIAYASLGRKEEARTESLEVLRIHPEFSLEHYAKTLPYKDQSAIDKSIESLRKAGLK